MAKEEVKATRYICDGCGKEVVVGKDEDWPDGYYFSTVTLIHPLGGTGATEVYACKDRCIRKAVEQAIDRQNRNE